MPDSVGRALMARGHTVIFHRDVLAEKTPDEVVAATALANDAILVAIDRDMRQIARRYGIGHGSDRFGRLSLIHLCCDEVQAAKRLGQAMSFIEHEWNISLQKVARRMWVDIDLHFLRTHR